MKYKLIIAVFLVVPTVFLEAAYCRLLGDGKKIMEVSEETWEVRDITDELRARVPLPEKYQFFDCHYDDKIGGFKYVAWNSYSENGSNIFIYDTLEKKYIFKVKTRTFNYPVMINFHLMKIAYVDEMEEDGRSIKVMVVASLTDEKDKIIIPLSGHGFTFMPPTVASSSRYFYIFVDGGKKNRALRIDAKTGIVDEPDFLKGRRIYDVLDDDSRFLIQDRTKYTEYWELLVLDNNGNELYHFPYKDITRARLSGDGKYVYWEKAPFAWWLGIGRTHLTAYDLTTRKEHQLKNKPLWDWEKISRPFRKADKGIRIFEK